MRQIRLGNANPFVTDSDTHCCIVLLNVHIYRTPCGTIFHGILEQVLQDLIETQLISFNQQGRSWTGIGDRVRRNGRQDFLDNPPDQRAQIHWYALNMQLPGLQPRDVELKLYQLVEASRLIRDHLQVALLTLRQAPLTLGTTQQ
jgi:hypothetical protein